MSKVITLPSADDRRLAEAFAVAMLRTGSKVKGGKQAFVKRLLSTK